MKLLNVLTAVSVVFLLWVAFSFCDVIADNNRPNPTHSEHNIFILINDFNETH